MSEQNFQTLQNVHEALSQKKTSVASTVDTYFKKIAASKLNAYISVCEERAKKTAVALDAKLKSTPLEKILESQPLFGMPLSVKDAIQVEGVRTTCGSKILEKYVAPYTATAVERLERAGAVVLGKLNMDEFAMGSSNENSAYGPVAHPTHPDRVAGGSSGGSACAVKAGLSIGTLGSDTGGSVRLPASFCGVVGLKPTYGRVSRYGLVAYGSSLDQIGPLASNVLDVSRIFSVMAGHDPKDSTCSTRELTGWGNAKDFSSVRIGVPREFFADGLEGEVRASIEAALKFFESRGAKRVEISLPHTALAVPVYYVIAVSEASSNLARFDGVRYGVRLPAADAAPRLEEFYETTRSLFGAEVKRRILLGTFALSSGYYDAYYKRACQVRRLIRQDYEEAFKKCDVIMGAASPTTAFKVGEKSADPLQMYLADIFTIPANLAGIPALCLPCGADKQGLPIGLQMMAPQFREDLLFSLGSGFEKR